MQTGIYAILNILNNKIYIGQASNINIRWRNHRASLNCDKHYNTYLQNAHNKYGKFAFIWYVIEECDKSILTEREQFWMNFYNSYNPEFGYNINPVAGSSLGATHSDEIKLAWSKQRKGQTRSKEAKATMRAAWVKRKADGNGIVSEETRNKISKGNKDKKRTDEWKADMSKRMTGHTFNVGRVQSKEMVENRVAKQTGQTRTPEQCENIREGKRRAKHRREKDLMWTW